MKIIVASPADCTELTTYFDVNRIAYTSVDFWQSDINNFVFPQDLTCQNQCLLVVSPDLLVKLFLSTKTKLQLLEFVKYNRLWIWPDIDGLVMALHHFEVLRDLDSLLWPNKILWAIDGQIVDTCELKNLRSIEFREMPYSWFLKYPRIESVAEVKGGAVKDFMITMVKKRNRPHREILWKELTKYPILLDRGHCFYRFIDDSWVGQTSLNHTWNDGHPSTDLYQSSWLELLSETLGEDGLFVTEKTVKPIATKTPFLILSTPGYLTYLKSFGFKTFDSVIDESYDNQTDVNVRAKLIVEQLLKISETGAENFYNQCRDICVHNHAVLLEISGKRQYVNDKFMAANLQQIVL